MSQHYDLVVKGGQIVNHDGQWTGDIGIRAGRIVDLGALDADRAAEVFDARGLTVLPGVIDTQVHFREPGMEHKEDLETGSRAAVLGGVTAVFEMPNTKPTTTSAAALADKVSRATNRMFCDFAFFVGGTRENIADIPALERLPGSAGIKVFIGSSTGDLLVDDVESLSAIVARLSRRASFHCEDEARLRERAGLRVPGDAASHPVWRDETAAMIATTQLLGLARRHGKRVHVLHVTTADEMRVVADHKDVATVEVTPQHLSLAAPEAYQRLGTRAQMNPPIRDLAHQAGLWEGLRLGVVDVLGSDHAPHTADEKAQAYPQSPSGMPGVQTLLPVMLTHVAAGRLSIERLVDLTSHGPSRVFGIANKGRIAVGYDADLAIVDRGRSWVVTSDWLASRAGWSPFEGDTLTGWPAATILRGQIIARDGAIIGPATGQPVRFTEALQPQA